MLLSKYCLASMTCSDNDSSVTWGSSSVRGWLNSTFYNTAFNSSEQNVIVETNVTTEGSSTQDKVYLLSIDEAKTLLGYKADNFGPDGQDFPFYPDLQASATKYVQAHEASDGNYCTGAGYNTGDQGYCFWWLRSSNDRDSLAGVDPDGSIEEFFDEYYMTFEETAMFSDISLSHAVRPVIWVKMAS